MADVGRELEWQRARIENEVEKRLKPDLDAVCERRDLVFEEMMELLQLVENVKLLKERNLGSMEMQVNIGEDFYMQAEVPDCSRIGVNCGFGIYVEMTLDEALTFVQRRHDALERRSQMYTKRITEIQAHLNLLLNGLAQLSRPLA